MKNTIHRKVALLVGVLFLAFANLSAENTEKTKSKWLDEQPKHIGLTWNVSMDVVSNYVWRGLYVGGLGIQPDFSVGYGGAFIDMWWNIGAGDWTFKQPYGCTKTKMNPEVDMTIGFSRWGLTVMFMHMYYFDYYKNFDGTISDNRSRYFNFDNTAPGGGITQEWRIKYKVSSKLPLSILWCTRTWGRDGYMIDGSGKQISCGDYCGMTPEQQNACSTKRAYSSYLELGYDFSLPYDMTLEARLGMTPWKSMYTGFNGDFAVCNVSAKLLRTWNVCDHLNIVGFANLMLNPYDIANNANGNGSVNGGRQCLWNVGCTFALK